MTKLKISLIGILLFSFVLRLSADEGMWIPLFLSKYNIADMKKKGFKLTAEDIYSINHASMKDAVMLFAGGCTAELISDQGLIITNHHCGYGSIQAQSSLEHDYLTDGFWAKDKSGELVNPNLSVTFLVRMEDVTQKVLSGVSDNMDEEKRSKLITGNIAKLEKEAAAGTRYNARIRPFFYGNEYYLFVTEVFRDVRLVGAPPSSIGKFGGDTDNWVWPRHTGDFSLFRIYANKSNEPAQFSADNIPYQPKKFFPISLKGVKKGDFTMVFGYPGSTQEYLTSFAIEMISKVKNPHRINIRQKKIDILAADMASNAEIRIKYSAKYAGISNSWKKWIGEDKGLKRLDAIEKKHNQEKKFDTWVKSDSLRKKKYGGMLPRYEAIYKELTPYSRAEDYFSEAVYTLDIFRLCITLNPLTKFKQNATEEEIKPVVEKIKKAIAGFYKDYNLATDKKIFTAMMRLCDQNIEPQFKPDLFIYKNAKTAVSNNKDDYEQLADYIYLNSMITDKAKLESFLLNFSLNSISQINNDPAYSVYSGFVNIYLDKVSQVTRFYEEELNRMNRIYMAGIREMQKDKVFYPDANSTLRVAFGQVDDYNPADGVTYKHFTTLDGVMEKEDTTIYDYKIPVRLKELYVKKDYGMYGENGVMNVCFIASNHTTGGNSGSPVINGKGELIGVNFDRNWEGTMSDLMYDPAQCRNISLDIRYALFIIDKFAGAGHLIKEMKIVK